MHLCVCAYALPTIQRLKPANIIVPSRALLCFSGEIPTVLVSQPPPFLCWRVECYEGDCGEGGNLARKPPCPAQEKVQVRTAFAFAPESAERERVKACPVNTYFKGRLKHQLLSFEQADKQGKAKILGKYSEVTISSPLKQGKVTTCRNPETERGVLDAQDPRGSLPPSPTQVRCLALYMLAMSHAACLFYPRVRCQDASSSL